MLAARSSSDQPGWGLLVRRIFEPLGEPVEQIGVRNELEGRSTSSPITASGSGTQLDFLISQPRLQYGLLGYERGERLRRWLYPTDAERVPCWIGINMMPFLAVQGRCRLEQQVRA